MNKRAACAAAALALLSTIWRDLPGFSWAAET
jgi:hypothetical protein